jgi:hypothetical protein
MSTLKLLGDSSGYVQLVANTAAQNNTLTLPNVTDTLANITSPTFLSNIALAGTGTAPSVGVFTDGQILGFATNNTERMRINNGGNLLIGTTTLANTVSLSVAGYGNTAGIDFQRGDVPASNQSVAGIASWSYDGTALFAGGTINFRAGENWSSTNHGTLIQFRVTPTGSGGTLFEAMRIAPSGNVGIGSTAPQQTLDVQGNVNVLNTVIMGSSFLRNRLINGGMQVAQYGTSAAPTVANFTYSMDRFFCAINSGTSGYTVTQLSQANTGLSGFYNALRYQRNSGQTNTTTMAFGQTIETANCYDLAGQTVTLSFWARAGANFSAASSQITARVATGTGTDQGSAGAYNGTWTGYAQTNTVVTITTSWVRYSVAVTIPSGVNEIQVLFYWAGVGTAGTNDYADFTGIQFEAGPVATAFERKLYNQTLADCQRYYFQIGGTAAQALPTGQAASATSAYIPIVFPVTLRIAPSGSNFSVSANSDWYMVNASVGSALTWTASTMSTADVQTALLQITVASGLVAGNASFAQAANTSARVKFSAEL